MRVEKMYKVVVQSVDVIDDFYFQSKKEAREFYESKLNDFVKLDFVEMFVKIK